MAFQIWMKFLREIKNGRYTWINSCGLSAFGFALVVIQLSAGVCNSFWTFFSLPASEKRHLNNDELSRILKVCIPVGTFP